MSNLYVVGPRGPKGDPGDGGGLSHDEVTGIVNAALAALPPSGLTSSAVQALIATALQPIETTAQVNAAIAAAIAALPADGVTSVAQVNAAIASALVSYENTAAVTAAIAAALSPYETASQVTAALSAAITRPHLEPVLYDDTYAWEVQPGSDVMATCVGVLPKFSWENGGAYMGLVTIAAGVTISDAGSWFLMPADSVLGEATFNDPGNLAIYNGAVPPGVYVAVNNANTPPYAFPEGWTPGNTTGAGPVLPDLGTMPGQQTHWFTGLVDIAEDGVMPGWGPTDNPNLWVAFPANSPLDVPTLHDMDGSLYLLSGQPVTAGTYLVAALANEPAAGPTALPEGWTLRPYGIGPVAITDENAGGLIGSVVHIVSGYVYNPAAWGLLMDNQWRGTFDMNESATFAIGDTFYSPGCGTALGRSLINGVLAMSEGGVPPNYGVDWEYVLNDAFPGMFWPYIERYDLAAKKWLPRIPLPMIPGPPSVAAIVVRPTGPWVSGIYARYDSFTYQGVTYYVTNEIGGGVAEPPNQSLVDSGFLSLVDPSRPEVPGPDIPFATEGGIAGVIDGKLYFGGGDGGGGGGATGQEFFVYDPADGSFAQLANFDVNDVPDYAPYGVAAGKLWYFGQGIWSFTPGPGAVWVKEVENANSQVSGYDQALGHEVDGKLWLSLSGSAFVFDPSTLEVTAKATAVGHGGNGSANVLIGRQIHEIGGEYEPYRIYDIDTDAYSLRSDLLNQVTLDGSGLESVAVAYDGVPYQLTGRLAEGERGVSGLTGRASDRPRGALREAGYIAAQIAAIPRPSEGAVLTMIIGPQAQATIDVGLTLPVPPFGGSLSRSMSGVVLASAGHMLVTNGGLIRNNAAPRRAGMEAYAYMTIVRRDTGASTQLLGTLPTFDDIYFKWDIISAANNAAIEQVSAYGMPVATIAGWYDIFVHVQIVQY